ncbi:hypothetical protein lerEdw1_013341 [Lerista edwardsae]|nr:hypothetical protein lerEdw1_013341 [Lerista edwardsae]
MGRGLGLLCVLGLLALGDACVKAKGELCRAWTYEKELSTKVFRCPGKLDEADAKFCCGTCSSPFCCSSRETRLDPAQCSAELKAWRDADAPQKRSISPQTVRDLLNLLWIGIGAIITLILCNWVCTCGANISRCLRLNPDWLRRFHHDQCGQRWLQQQMELVARGPGAGGTRSSAVGSPAPHGNYQSPDLPPYSAENCLGSRAVQFHCAIEENWEDEVVILSPPPIPPRTGLVHNVVPTLEEEETTAEHLVEEEDETA